MAWKSVGGGVGTERKPVEAKCWDLRTDRIPNLNPFPFRRYQLVS